ncbi:hypothetical protein CF651_30795 [Paenibacillus rigui]|uniref:SLH domain-containing protein n=1 Tax=Paenibacillus rigui TaxID=554312 RepID=A0A229UHT4_9BACL|nr:hypothetical protein CF651_30795 [Paenibacillus rigui]
MFSDQGYISPNKRTAVDEAVKKGLLSGYPDASFRPNQLLTRQELAVLLVKAMHLEPKQGVVSSFSDMKDNWAIPYIEALVEAGLINGDGSNTYRPSEPVTREELAAVFVRVINGVDAKGGKEASVVDSKEISPWAEKAVSLAMRLGLMNAEGNAFDPRGKIERQDIAAYLLDIFKTQEQTATIDRIDRDMVIIDGKPYLINGALKDLLGDRNREALEGAVLKYKSVNHNVNDLLRIEITKSGADGKPVELDLRGTSFKGELAIAADHIAVKGDSLPQVVLKHGAGSLDLRAKVTQVVVDTSKPVKIEGSGAWGELKISNPDTSLSLGKGVTIEKLKIPENASADKLISNFKEAMNQISSLPASGAQPPAVSPGSSGSSNSSDSSSDSNRTPTVVKAVYNRSGYIGSGHVMVDLKQVFTDPDGDSLNISAQSSDRAVADVALSGGTLALIPNRVGLAVITVRAADGKGGVAQTTFTFEVHEAAVNNHAPKSTRLLEDQTFVEGAVPQSIPVADLFTDEDGDSLTLAVYSDQASVVEAVYGNGFITLTPRRQGSSSIGVTADDGKGGIGQVVFGVAVTIATPVNHAPVVVKAPSSLTQAVKDGSKKVSLVGVFADEDGDKLAYSARSSDMGVATVAISGTDLTITPVAAGTATITVTANDGNDGSKPTMFTVTFEAPVPENHAPVVANNISDVTANITGGSKTVSLTNVFTDEDNDALTYSAVTSDTGVATVAVSGTDLKITPVSAGTVTITVTANDGNDGSKPTMFTVTFEAVVPKGLFFSELVWGQNDSFLQAIELYNPTEADLDATKIRIERSNGGDPITLENGSIASGVTFTIVESFYFGSDVPVDYNTMMNFYADDAQPVTLSLYYNNILVDIGVFYPHKSVTRVSGTVIGSTTAYDAQQWKDEGDDYIDGLGKFTP